MTRLRQARAVAAPLIVSLVLVACGGQDDRSADEAAIRQVVVAIAEACEDSDHARLGDLTGGPGSKDRLRSQDNVFNPAVSDVSVAGIDTRIDGSTASVSVDFEVVVDGEISEVGREWEFVEVDGGWWPAEPLDCSFLIDSGS